MSIQKNIGHSPRKLRLVADMVRKMSPERAILTLQFTNRAAAGDLAKVIKSAMANAQGKTGLVFKTLEINEGLKLGRIHVGTAGRGRNRPYKKRFSHIKVILTDEPLARGKATEPMVEAKSAKKVASVKAEPVVEEPKTEVMEAEVVAEKPAKAAKTTKGAKK